MRIMIYGAGAMGTVLGAFATRAGTPADLVTRNICHVQALNKTGAHITGTIDFAVPVHALTPDEITATYDIIVLMTKQGANKETLEFLLPHLAEDGLVCTTQNGLPEPSVAEVVGKNRCCGCAVSWGATFVGDGNAVLTTKTDALQFALGRPYPGVNEQNFQYLKQFFGCMGKVEEEQNFAGARWIKLAINCAFSSLSALSGLTFGQVAKGDISRKAALGIFTECIAVCNACGIRPAKIQGHYVAKLLSYRGKLKKRVALWLLPVVMKNHAALQSGMLFDLKKGKKCEIDYMNGAVISHAKGKNVATPFNNLAVEIIRKIEDGKLEISPDNINLFKNLI